MRSLQGGWPEVALVTSPGTRPTYQSSVLFTAPKIPLRNRVLASTVAYKTGALEPGTAAGTDAPKTSRLGRVALGALNKVSGATPLGQRAPYQLPSATDEHCATKGTPPTLEQIQTVPAGATANRYCTLRPAGGGPAAIKTSYPL